MMGLRTEDALVGLVALALVPWIIWTMMRGIREGRLPMARGHVARVERRAAFNVLMGLYAIMLVLAAIIALDLLLGIKIWNLG
jgi:hypothetical protein